ncbi:unnamed protein product [Owenia fusiformis]|uniref:Proteasome assembly chaperone 3 n=1 Tax=Owenia fusiformis TaxID=6347 RepID=A0A8S4Q7V3_OWEFU|nr:unnamed protein product [Owenia fusiformis]
MEGPLIKSKKSKVTCGDIETEIVISDFGDKLFILATQFQKIGNLTLVSKDVVLQNGIATYTTKVFLGKDEPMTHVFARSLAAKIDTPKDLLVSTAFRNSDKDMMKEVEKSIVELVDL